MIVKTHSGIQMLDESMGGVYSKRCFLISGKRGSGRTVTGLHFLQRGLQNEERCLCLSTMAGNDLLIFADALGIPLEVHTEHEDLILLEYASFTPGAQTPGKDMLPPEGFEQLRRIIDTHSIKRVLLDTVLPWVAVTDSERMAEQVFSFVRSFERLGVTTMMTLPQPVSQKAHRLKNCLEEVVPISILLKRQGDPPDTMHTMQVVKYLGAHQLGPAVPFSIQAGAGISPPVASTPPAPSAPETRTTERIPLPDTVEADSPQPQERTRVGFSQAGRTAQRPAPDPAPAPPSEPQGPTKLSSVWQPTDEEESS